MECQRIKTLDGALELSLRVLLILSKYDAPMSKERIIVYDYVSCSTLSKSNTQRLTYIGIHKTINESLHILLTKQLVECRRIEFENQYKISEIGKAMVEGLLKVPYAKKLQDAIIDTDKTLHNMNETDLSAYIHTLI